MARLSLPPLLRDTTRWIEPAALRMATAGLAIG